MSTLALRYSGLILAAGSIFLAVAMIVISLNPVTNQIITPGASWLLLLAAVLLTVSLPVIYLKQADAPRFAEAEKWGKLWGWLALAGHVLLQVGVLLFVLIAAPAMSYSGLKLPTTESAAAFLLGSSLFLGLLLTGLAAWQAKIYPRWQWTLLLAAAAGFFLSFFVAEFLPPIFGQIVSAIMGVVLAAALAGMGVFIYDPELLTAKYWAQ